VPRCSHISGIVVGPSKVQLSVMPIAATYIRRGALNHSQGI
jgi:hypothetical protein